MKAHNNYVLVKLIDEAPANGIIIPDAYKDASPKGEVISKGHLVDDSIKVGDIIYYHAKTGIQYEDMEFIKAEQILAVYNGNN